MLKIKNLSTIAWNLKRFRPIPCRPFSVDKKTVEQLIQEQIEKDEKEFLPGLKNEKKQVIEHKKVNMRNDIDTYDEGEKDVYFYDDEKLPLSVRERRQTAQVYEMFKEKAQWGEFYRVYGIVLFLLGGYFLTIPFYNVICQTFGFTMSQHAKEYKFKDEQVNVYRKFKVSFMSHTQDEIPWEFEPSTPTIVVNAGETALSFYKVFNRADRPIAGIAIYQIFPEEAALYFNKIQCFCFENQLLYPNESLDLPLLFYLDPAINHDPTLADCKEIFLTYHFFPSADQTIAEVLQVEIEKHQREELELQNKKRELIARGVKGIDETKNHGVIAQGYNPKDRPEMFIKKIVQSQKRIQYTIDQFVKENGLDATKVNINKVKEEEKIEEIEARIFPTVEKVDESKLYEYKNNNQSQKSVQQAAG